MEFLVLRRMERSQLSL